MREPITTDHRMSYIDAWNKHVIYSLPTACAICNRCLAGRTGHCAYGGPFPPFNAIPEGYTAMVRA